MQSQPIQLVFELIGRAVASQPKKVRRLLKAYDISYPDSKSEKKTINALLFALKTKGISFQKDLAKLLKTTSFQTAKEDSFDLKGLLGSAGETAGKGINVGTDPISMAIGLVSSGLNLVGNNQQRKAMEKQARSKSFASMLEFKKLQMQQASEQFKRQQQLKIESQRNKAKSESNEQLYTYLGLLALTGLIGFVIYKKKFKQPEE